jgi:hypothetical protein
MSNHLIRGLSGYALTEQQSPPVVTLFHAITLPPNKLLTDLSLRLDSIGRLSIR